MPETVLLLCQIGYVKIARKGVALGNTIQESIIKIEYVPVFFCLINHVSVWIEFARRFVYSVQEK